MREHFPELYNEFPKVNDYLGDRFEFAPMEWQSVIELPAGTVIKLSKDRRGYIFESLGSEASGQAYGWLSAYNSDGQEFERMNGEINVFRPAPTSSSLIPKFELKLEEKFIQAGIERIRTMKVRPIIDAAEILFVPEIALRIGSDAIEQVRKQPFESAAAQQVLGQAAIYFLDEAQSSQEASAKESYEKAAQLIQDELLRPD